MADQNTEFLDEVPEADAQEQATEVEPGAGGDEPPPQAPFEADPADVAEQSRAVPGRDDDEPR